MDAREIRRWHQVFKRDGELFEIRILGDRTFSGYFYDVEEAINQLVPYENSNIYYSLNEVKPACASREQFNCFRQVKGTATSKIDIEHRWWMACDVDCDRPSGVSSTDAEKEKAHKKAREVYTFLRENGFSDPVICDSSSGYHIIYPIDMENTQESEDCVKAFLEVLSDNFTDESVKIDKVLHDANRILRLPGSYGRKGRSTKERPHRLARILYEPSEIRRMTLGQVQAFNEKYKIEVEQPQRRSSYNGQQEEFSLRDFIRKYNIEIAKEVPMSGGGTKYILKECVFDSSHHAPDAALFEMPNGAIAYKCYHNSCSHYGWRDFRLHFDAHAYDQRQQPYQPQPYTPKPQRQPFSPPAVKPESEEKGKKWRFMRDIKKINILDIPHFFTGFPVMDEAIKGLFLGEVTILSGSNSSGKSSWLNTLVLNVINQDIKVALWSGELLDEVIKAWIQMVAAGRDHLRPTPSGEYWYVPDTIGEKIDEWCGDKLSFYNKKYSSSWTQLFSDIKDEVGRGVKLVILDNLMSLDIDIVDGTDNAKQKALITQLCDMAKELQIHVILVAHPRKVTSFLRKPDISGTSDLTNAADNVFIMHRVNNDFIKMGGEFFGVASINLYKSFSNVMEVAKNRMMGVQDKLFGMYYEVESRRFKSSENEVRPYGWLETPKQSYMFPNTGTAPVTPPVTPPDMPFERNDGGEEMPF